MVSRKKSKPVIMMTGYESPPDVKLVKELGGVLTNKVSECTVLITDKIRRTSKFLCALGLGIPIVSPNWLVQSKMTKTFLGNYYYLFFFEITATSRPWESKLSSFHLEFSFNSIRYICLTFLLPSDFWLFMTQILLQKNPFI